MGDKETFVVNGVHHSDMEAIQGAAMASTFMLRTPWINSAEEECSNQM